MEFARRSLRLTEKFWLWNNFGLDKFRFMMLMLAQMRLMKMQGTASPTYRFVNNRDARTLFSASTDYTWVVGDDAHIVPGLCVPNGLM